MVKKVILPDKYIIQAIRLIKIRWLVSVFAFVLISLFFYIDFTGPYYTGLYISLSLLLLLNLFYYIDIIRIEKSCEKKCEKPAKVNISLQIVFDFLLLTVMLHFSGGIENHAIIFYVFHLILSGIYLRPRNAYRIAFLAVFLFLSLVLSEYFGFVKHYSVNQYVLQVINNEPAYLFISLSLFVFTSLLAVFIAVSLSEQLRITQKLLKESNKSLLEKDKIKDEYVQRLTHDIKGGLAVVHSSISVVDKQILGNVNDANADFIKRAMNRTKGMLTFVNELLNLTKMRLENRFDTAPVDVVEVIRSVVASNAHDAQKKNITVKFDTEADILKISAIRVSIEETMANLIQNAVKYTPDGGKVNISAKKISDKVVIEVEDTGYGIPEDDVPHIFDEFYRANNVTKIEGTGLGLALVKVIVTRHHGTINVKSKLNSGTTFTVTFNALK